MFDLDEQGFTELALVEIANLLSVNGVGTYRANGVYADDETGIVVGHMPDKPDRCIALVPYPLTDDPTLADSVLGLQVRARTGPQDPRPVMRITDAAFGLLQGWGDVNLPNGAGRILIAERRSSIPLGWDQNSRAEWSDNYQLTLHRPTVHRI